LPDDNRQDASTVATPTESETPSDAAPAVFASESPRADDPAVPQLPTSETPPVQINVEPAKEVAAAPLANAPPDASPPAATDGHAQPDVNQQVQDNATQSVAVPPAPNDTPPEKIAQPHSPRQTNLTLEDRKELWKQLDRVALTADCNFAGRSKQQCEEGMLTKAREVLGDIKDDENADSSLRLHLQADLPSKWAMDTKFQFTVTATLMVPDASGQMIELWSGQESSDTIIANKFIEEMRKRVGILLRAKFNSERRKLVEGR
jgi:hypothetical protein